MDLAMACCGKSKEAVQQQQQPATVQRQSTHHIRSDCAKMRIDVAAEQTVPAHVLQGQPVEHAPEVSFTVPSQLPHPCYSAPHLVGDSSKCVFAIIVPCSYLMLWNHIQV